MILGSVKIKPGVIVTHKRTFAISPLTNFGVDRPLLVPAIFAAGASVGFTTAFADILYASEIIGALIFAGIFLLAGHQIGLLRLHGSDMRGSTLGHALWGRHGDLQKARSDIEAQLDATTTSNSEDAL